MVNREKSTRSNTVNVCCERKRHVQRRDVYERDREKEDLKEDLALGKRAAGLATVCRLLQIYFVWC